MLDLHTFFYFRLSWNKNKFLMLYFIDSSDDHYIFSLSFKLNGGVRHVRIEHDHGNIFSYQLIRCCY